MRTLIESKVAALKKRSFSELAKLPKHQQERLLAGKKPITLSVWKDEKNEHELRIVVQAYRHWFLGIGRMDATGFEIDRSGNIRDLPRNEIYDFV